MPSTSTALNRAARLRGVARGGATVMSQATAEIVHERLRDVQTANGLQAFPGRYALDFDNGVTGCRIVDNVDTGIIHAECS